MQSLQEGLLSNSDLGSVGTDVVVAVGADEVVVEVAMAVMTVVAVSTSLVGADDYLTSEKDHFYLSTTESSPTHDWISLYRFRLLLFG